MLSFISFYELSKFFLIFITLYLGVYNTKMPQKKLKLEKSTEVSNIQWVR